MRHSRFLAIIFLSLAVATGLNVKAHAKEQAFNIRADQVMQLVEALNFIPAEVQGALLQDGLAALASYNRLAPAEQRKVRVKINAILQEINNQNR